MRLLCPEARWEDNCLCQKHTEEVIRGEASAPSIRRTIDYQSCSRKTFLKDCSVSRDKQETEPVDLVLFTDEVEARTLCEDASLHSKAVLSVSTC